MNSRFLLSGKEFIKWAKIKRFCMYALSHTYVTRAITCGMMPKVLQRLLGHTSIKTTMDRYAHVTGVSLTNAVKQFEQSIFWQAKKTCSIKNWCGAYSPNSKNHCK